MASRKDRRGRIAQANIPPLVPAVVAVIVAGVMVVVVAGTTGDGSSVAATTTTTAEATTTTFFEPTTTTTTLPDPVPVESVLVPGLDVDPPASYQVTYEVVEHGLVREETWIVRRPYESLVTSTRDGTLISGTATSRQALRTYLSDRDGWLTIQPELHRAAYDQRPAGSLGILEDRGIVEHLGSDQYLGRTCERYRTGPPPSGVDRAGPSEDEYTDLCVDQAGLVLHELWALDGDPVSERTATDLAIGVQPSDEIFEGGDRIQGDDEAAALFQQIAVPADEETMARLETEFAPPAGFTLDRTVFRAATGQQASSDVTEIVRFYPSGPDLLEVVEQYVPGSVDLSGGAAVRIDVEGWDEVWLEADFRTAALRARLSDESVLELRHHDPAFLVEMLNRIERRE